MVRCLGRHGLNLSETILQFTTALLPLTRSVCRIHFCARPTLSHLLLSLQRQPGSMAECPSERLQLPGRQ
jgi:hypothetical protein